MIIESLDTTDGCFECLAIGSTWVNLRQCLNDGKIRCCDSSPNQHATKHYQKDGHPIVYLLEDGSRWCYVHELHVQYR